MKRKIIITSDGSTTIYLPEWNEHYHSKYGAIQEAYHVFIKNGLAYVDKKKYLSILEVGFGTGLNCLVSYLEAVKNNLTVEYTGIEAYPVTKQEIEKLNYTAILNAGQKIFDKMHSLSWEERYQLSPSYSFLKKKQFFEDITDKNQYDLIYFDAFGAGVQPELWTETIFKKMFEALQSNGILVTYSAKGSVRRAMQKVGFTVERLPGPPHKREMLRALKPL